MKGYTFLRTEEPDVNPEISPNVLKQSVWESSKVTYSELGNSVPSSSKISYQASSKKKNFKSINLLKDFASINTQSKNLNTQRLKIAKKNIKSWKRKTT